jgi:hypothetical protein
MGLNVLTSVHEKNENQCMLMKNDWKWMIFIIVYYLQFDVRLGLESPSDER